LRAKGEEHKQTARKSKQVFTIGELAVLYQILRATWEEIAYDACQDGDLSRSTVIELVLDADRAKAHVKTEQEREVWEVYETLPYPKMREFAKGAFPYAKYGM
jgi:hypothetical protein